MTLQEIAESEAQLCRVERDNLRTQILDMRAELTELRNRLREAQARREVPCGVTFPTIIGAPPMPPRACIKERGHSGAHCARDGAIYEEHRPESVPHWRRVDGKWPDCPFCGASVAAIHDPCCPFLLLYQTFCDLEGRVEKLEGSK